MTNFADFFDDRVSRGVPLALATVVETRGSTYSKSGARLIIDRDGVYRGLLSGGCLEGDLGIRAAQVIESGRPLVTLYDLSSDDDDLWGMGVGCDGSLRVLIQPLSVDEQYEPMASVMRVRDSDDAAVLVTVVESSREGPEIGASLFVENDEKRAIGLPDDLVAAAERAAAAAASTRRSGLSKVSTGVGDAELHCAYVEPRPRLLILGAGPDVAPLLRIACELDWRTTIVDHRPAYIESGAFDTALETHCIPADRLSESIDLSLYDRAVIMSHHLDSDRAYLSQLADTGMNYIGLLGPPARRERLLSELGPTAAALGSRLHGPAGIDIRARGPAAIALSIAAEMLKLLR